MQSTGSCLIFTGNLKRGRKVLVARYGSGVFVALTGAIVTAIFFPLAGVWLGNFMIPGAFFFALMAIIWLIPLIWVLRITDTKLEEVLVDGFLPFFIPQQRQYFKVSGTGIQYSSLNAPSFEIKWHQIKDIHVCCHPEGDLAYPKRKGLASRSPLFLVGYEIELNTPTTKYQAFKTRISDKIIYRLAIQVADEEIYIEKLTSALNAFIADTDSLK